jgi:hypothetical protein
MTLETTCASSRELGVGCGGGGVEALDPLGEVLDLGQQGGLVLALGAATCLPMDFCSARAASNWANDDRRRSSAARIASTTTRVLATGQLRAPDDVGVLTQELDVDHARQPIEPPKVALDRFRRLQKTARRRCQPRTSHTWWRRSCSA